MIKVIVDCQHGVVEVLPLTLQEEEVRLAEIQEAIREAKKDKDKESKRQLLTMLAELREMKQNKDVFTDEDVAEKEAEIDRVKNLL